MGNTSKEKSGGAARFERVLLLAVLVMTSVLYFSILNTYFICDDFIAIQESLPKPDVTVYDLIAEPGRWFLRPITTHWFPATTFSYALDYALYGAHPLGYHVTNLLFYWLCALAIYFLALRLAPQRGVAFLTALLFLMHPIHTEAV